MLFAGPLEPWIAGLLLGGPTTLRAFLFGLGRFQSGREKTGKSASLTWMYESNKGKEVP